MMKRINVLFALFLAWLSVGGAWAEEETFKIVWARSESKSTNILLERNKGHIPDESSKKYVRLYAKGDMTITPKLGYVLTKIDYEFTINSSKGYKPTPKLTSTAGTFKSTATGGTWSGITTKPIVLLVDGLYGNIDFSSVTITYITSDGTADKPYTVTDVFTLNQAGSLPTTEVYIKGNVVKTDQFDSSSPTLNYYIADSENAANSLEVLNGRYLQDADITNANQIVRGDEVIVKATVETTNKGAKVLKDVHLISIKEYQDQAKVSSAGWATFVSRRAVDFSNTSNISVYTVKYDATVNKVTLTPVRAIPGNTAVVVKGKEGTYNLQRSKESTAVANNDLKFSDTDTKVTSPFNIYVLAQQGDGCGFYPVKAGETLAPFKGYLCIKTASTAAAKPFYAIGDNTTTGINTVEKAKNMEGVRYNFAGQRVNNSYKGLVIVNGHKVIIK